MSKNMGTLDRGLRIFVAILIGALWMTGQIGGLLAIVLGVVALVFVATSFVGSCPLYGVMGVTTRERITDLPT